MQGLIAAMVRATVLAAFATVVVVGPAYADGMSYGSIKDAPPPPAHDWSISYNAAATTDYVFRGISQSNEDPTVQAGVDVTYKLFYLGVWGSGIDFGTDANVEIDVYAGIKPVVGPFTFDFGVIYYAYPKAGDPSGAELDYVELKGGVSGSFWKDGTIGATAFYSPEYTGETGEVWTFEGSISQALPKIRDITPTFSALIGYEMGDDTAFEAAFGTDNYVYWNAGMTFGFHERFAIDVRYWDTDLSGGCGGLCDERVVATAKVTY